MSMPPAAGSSASIFPTGSVESWAAVNLEPEQPLLPGAEVVVMGRDGTGLQVLASKVEP